MKGKKELKAANSKKPATVSSDNFEKKRRNSLTDTPITSSSSSEGMASTDGQPCSSKSASRRKRRSQKIATADWQKVSFSDLLSSSANDIFSAKNTPVYTIANASTTNTTSTTFPRCSTSISHGPGIPEVNFNVDVIFNKSNTTYTPSNKNLTNNEWMESVRYALITGNHEMFLCGLRYLCVILCRNSTKFKAHTKQKLLQYVVESLVTSYYDPVNQITIFMDLCSTKAANCSKVDHGFCRLTRTLLQHMDVEKVSKMLAISAKTQRTVLHYAVITGNLCQVRVLLEYDVDVEAADKDNHTPLFYALKNKNIEMVKLLLWYGADFSHRPKFNEKLTIHAEAFDSKILSPWFEQRTTALAKKFYSVLAEMCRGIFSFKADDALSDFHVMRCSYNMDADLCVGNTRQKTGNWLMRSIKLHFRENFEPTKNSIAILFVVPFCYSPLDQASPADAPCIYNTTLFINNGQQNKRALQLFPANPLIQTPDSKIYELTSVLQNTHNGYIYCYKMPLNVQKKSYTLSSNVTLDGLTSVQKRTTLLGIQAFRITNQKFNQKKLN